MLETGRYEGLHGKPRKKFRTQCMRM
jgi:hypothetical protein